MRQFPAHACWKPWAAHANAFAASAPPRSASAQSIRSTLWRSTSRQHPARGCWRGRLASRTVSSNTTARSPNAKSRHHAVIVSAVPAGNSFGTSAPVLVRWRSNGCWPIRRCAPSPSSSAATAPRVLHATPLRSACPDCRSWSRPPLPRSGHCRARTRSSSAAAPALRASLTRRRVRCERAAAWWSTP